MKTNIHFRSYLAHFFLEGKIFLTKVVEKIKTHFYIQKKVFQKLFRLWDNVEKYCREGQATDEWSMSIACIVPLRLQLTLRIS